MPSYRYRARMRDGRAEQGTLEAAGEDEALSLLQSRGLVITALEVAATPTAPAPPTTERPLRAARGGRVKTTDLVASGGCWPR